MAIFRLAAAVAATFVTLAAAPSSAAEKMTVSQYGRIIATLPWAMALHKGLFKEEGLDIDGIVTSAGGGTSVRNMLAGDLPYAEVATPAAIAALRAGVELVIVNTSSNHIGELSWASRPGSTVKTIQDLAGKKVAFTAPKSTTEMLLRMVLEKNGLMGKVETLSIGGLGPALTALAQGAIDAGPVTDPALTLQAERYNVIFAAADQIPKVTWSVGVTTKAFARSNPDKLRALIRTHRKAVDYVYAHQSEAAEVYAKVWEIERAHADKIIPKYYGFKHWSRGDFDKEGLETMSTGMVVVGEIDKPVDWKAIIDQSFLPEDMRRPL
jgi:NitT/TauT family transport system substrate-binding protein